MSAFRLALAQALTTAGRLRPKRILNIGIAGAYPGSGLQIGDIVHGASEVYGDVGFELPAPPGFRHVGESEWGNFYQTPLPLRQFAAFPSCCTSGSGCTVNACTGTEETGRLRETLFGAAFETMEGAAVAQAGQLLGHSPSARSVPSAISRLRGICGPRTFDSRLLVSLLISKTAVRERGIENPSLGEASYRTKVLHPKGALPSE